MLVEIRRNPWWNLKKYLSVHFDFENRTRAAWFVTQLLTARRNFRQIWWQFSPAVSSWVTNRVARVRFPKSKSRDKYFSRFHQSSMVVRFYSIANSSETQNQIRICTCKIQRNLIFSILTRWLKSHHHRGFWFAFWRAFQVWTSRKKDVGVKAILVLCLPFTFQRWDFPKLFGKSCYQTLDQIVAGSFPVRVRVPQSDEFVYHNTYWFWLLWGAFRFGFALFQSNLKRTSGDNVRWVRVS